MLNTSFPYLNKRLKYQQGLSIVELMVGMAIGLFITIGLISLFVNNLGSSRTLTIEARVNQNLRAAADLIARDLRRAGYWGNAVNGTIASGAASTTPQNPYIAIATSTSVTTSTTASSISTSSTTSTTAATATQIEYHFTRDAAENNALDNNEYFGFRLENGNIEMKTNGSPTWQAITDPNIVTITGFTITQNNRVLPVGDICQFPCAPGSTSSTGACPTLTVRSYDIRIRGNATNHSAITRELQTNVRVRNDQFSGACPIS